MSDRAAFLTAIATAPGDDTARLVYADWLDEHGTGDLDRATAEFIRMSCSRVGMKRMPKAVYPWLLSKGEDGHVVENWKRFLPTLLAIDAEQNLPGFEAIGRRNGREVYCTITLPPRGANSAEKRDSWVRSYSVMFDFTRGFVSGFYVSSFHAARVGYPAVVSDQPLAELHVVGLYPDMHTEHAETGRELLGMIDRHQGAEAAARFARRYWMNDAS